MRSPSKITLLSLRTYPAWWQERYRDEMDVVIDGLLEDGQSPLRISFNLLGGSLRARLLGTGAPASRQLWSRRTQTALLVATLPWFAMIPLVAIFSANSGEYGSFHGSHAAQLPRAGVFAHNFESIVFDLAFVSFLIVVFGWSRLRDGLAQRQKKGWLPRASLVAVIFGVGLVLVVLPFGLYTSTATGCFGTIGGKSSFHCVTKPLGLTIAQVLAFTGLALLVVAFVLAPFVIARAVRGSDLPDVSLRSGSRVATVLSTLFVVMAVAILGCGVAAALQPTPLKGMGYYLERSALGGWYVLLAAAFVTLAVVSSLGTFAARRSYRRTIALEG
jgi:uncharacterized membrane protein YidH (DUF202 family)